MLLLFHAVESWQTKVPCFDHKHAHCFWLHFNKIARKINQNILYWRMVVVVRNFNWEVVALQQLLGDTRDDSSSLCFECRQTELQPLYNQRVHCMPNALTQSQQNLKPRMRWIDSLHSAQPIRADYREPSMRTGIVNNSSRESRKIFRTPLVLYQPFSTRTAAVGEAYSSDTWTKCIDPEFGPTRRRNYADESTRLHNNEVFWRRCYAITTSCW